MIELICFCFGALLLATIAWYVWEIGQLEKEAHQLFDELVRGGHADEKDINHYLQRRHRLDDGLFDRRDQ